MVANLPQDALRCILEHGELKALVALGTTSRSAETFALNDNIAWRVLFYRTISKIRKGSYEGILRPIVTRMWTQHFFGDTSITHVMARRFMRTYVNAAKAARSTFVPNPSTIEYMYSAAERRAMVAAHDRVSGLNFVVLPATDISTWSLIIYDLLDRAQVAVPPDLYTIRTLVQLQKDGAVME